MFVRIFLLCSFAALIGCRPAPFRVEKLTPKEPGTIQPSESLDVRLDRTLAERYRKKKSPTFALINGYYRLPETKLYGSATVVKSFSYQTYFEGITVTKGDRDYAITPIQGDDAISLDKAMNALLDAGIKIKEITMSDAMTIAQAEQKASQSKAENIFGKVLPPDVDYLISVYPASSARGPVLVGRVIKRDGTLMAFRVMYRGDNPHLAGSVIASLVEDTIGRI